MLVFLTANGLGLVLLILSRSELRNGFSLLAPLGLSDLEKELEEELEEEEETDVDVVPAMAVAFAVGVGLVLRMPGIFPEAFLKGFSRARPAGLMLRVNVDRAPASSDTGCAVTAAAANAAAVSFSFSASCCLIALKFSLVASSCSSFKR